MAPRITIIADRFWSKVIKAEGDGCWTWIAGTIGGYGRFTVDGSTILAHRVSWEMENGAIPAGMLVLHRCDNPSCVRPSHLFLGSHVDNMADKKAKGRAAKGPAFGAVLSSAAERRFQAKAAIVIEAEANLPAVAETGSRSFTVTDLAARQADSDHHLVALWIGRHSSPHTRRNYQRQADRFLGFVRCPLVEVRIGDIQAYIASLDGLASGTRAAMIAAVKSLLSFGQEIGYLRVNLGKAVKAPPVKNTLAERIMSESDAMRMLALEANPRNRALLTLMYGGGLRVSEACGLCWRDLAARDEAGQATIFGKGGKTRTVLLSANTWGMLQPIRGEAGADDPVFLSRKGGHLDVSAVHRIVKAAAARAGLSDAISAHWLRHGHASHSLDRGAPIHLVQATLGHASVATTGRYVHARPTDSSARYLGV